jgi:hypothetical protein
MARLMDRCNGVISVISIGLYPQVTEDISILRDLPIASAVLLIVVYEKFGVVSHLLLKIACFAPVIINLKNNRIFNWQFLL